MNNPYRLSRAHDQYQSLALASRLEGTGPHGLVTVLYDELLRSLDVMGVAITREKDLNIDAHTTRARSILIALEGSLDFDRGGDLAATLASVYRAMQGQLRQVVAGRDKHKLLELREGVVAIAESWTKIVR